MDYADIESSDSDAASAGTDGKAGGQVAGSAAGQVAGSADRHSRIICDPDRDRILFSFPFYDSYSVYRGTIVFYTAASAFSRELVKLNLLAMTDNVIFTGTAERPVFVLDFPNTGRNILQDILIRKFSGDVSFTEKIMETDKSDVWLLFSKKSASNIYVSRLYEENLFVFSDTVRILLLASVFITAYLIIFLIFNVKQDDMLIIRERIKRFQFAVINDYLAAKEEVDWNAVYADMSRRKTEINGAIKKSLGGKAKRHAQETDLLLEKSWDEILSALHRQSAAKEKLNLDTLTAELKEMMGKIISSRDFTPSASSAVPAASPQSVSMQAVPTAGGSAGTLSGAATNAAAGFAGSAVGAKPAFAAVPEAEEAIPEAEAVRDAEFAEPVDDAEPIFEAEPILEAEPVDEAEVLAEAEPIFEAEPILEAEAAAPDVSAGASTGAASTAAGEVPAEEPEDAEEVEEAEPVSEEAEEVEELEEIPAADESVEALAEGPSAKAESADKRTDAGGEDIFDLDFVKDSAVLAGLENNEDEVSDVPQTPAAAEEKIDDLLDRSFFELASAKKEESAARIATTAIKAVNEEKPAAEDGEDEEGEDIFNEELKIGESQSEKNAANAADSFSNSENDFSDFKIEKPDFSILDEPAPDAAGAAFDKMFETEQAVPAAAENAVEDESAAEGAGADFVEPLPFSFTFGKIGEKADVIGSADEPILEQDGLFVIAKEAGENVTKQKLDTEFQMLVDSVLK